MRGQQAQISTVQIRPPPSQMLIFLLRDSAWREKRR